MMQFSLTFFGPPQIKYNGSLLKIARRKALALLAYLAVSEQDHSRDALAVLFWPEADQSRARAALRSALWALNKTPLAHFLVVESEQVGLRLSPTAAEHIFVDVLYFREKIAAWRQHHHNTPTLCPDCLAGLTESIALYKDDFLAGFTLPDAPAFDEWHFFQTDSQRQTLAAALDALIAHYRAQGEPHHAVPLARRYVALDPLHEPAQRLLMQLYAEAGQHSAARRQFEQCRQILQDELRVDPSPETLALYETLQKTPAAGHPIASHSVHNLPPNPTPFIGRQKERSQLASYFKDPSTRLLTILGPGGIGKTRLALAVAADLAASGVFPDGVYFVPLASFITPDAIVPAIAESVGFSFQADSRSPRQQLLDYLHPRKILLLLDNLEHLLPDGADVVTALLRHAPRLKLLVTSRERLNLVEEQGFGLTGLDVADTAVTLLQQAIHRRLPDCTINLEDARDVCRLVDGMPLALELAASWADVLSLREIAARVRQSLDFLESDLRNLPARHRSMRAVFDTTWQSLSQSEQDVYARLGLFQGGFTAEVAQAVAGASLKTLSAFISKSLLRFNPHRQRYEMHELLRQFAAEKLAGDPKTQARHSHYICAFLRRLEADLKGARQQQALSAIEQDLENARAAWQWALVHRQTDLLAQALEPLAFFYQWRKRYGEGETLCQTAVSTIVPTAEVALPLPPEEAILGAQLLTWLGVFQLGTGQIERARATLQQAQDLLDKIEQPSEMVMAVRAFLLLHCSFYSIANKFGGQAITLNEESLALYRAIGDKWGTALALDALGQKYLSLGAFDRAFQFQEECLKLREQLDDQLGIARSYALLGLLLVHTGQFERSETYLRRSLDIYGSLGSRADLANPLAMLAINWLFRGQFERCLDTLAECWTIHRELGLTYEPFTANVTGARALINLGRYEEAKQLMESVLPEYRQANFKWGIAFVLCNLAMIFLIEGDPEGALAYLQESNELLGQMNEQRLRMEVLFYLGFVHRRLEKRSLALQALRDGLEIVIATLPLNLMRFELPLAALLRLDEGQTEHAIELYTAAQQSPYIANSLWFESFVGQEIEAAADTLPPNLVAAARQRGQAHDLEMLVRTLWAEGGEERKPS